MLQDPCPGVRRPQHARLAWGDWDRQLLRSLRRGPGSQAGPAAVPRSDAARSWHAVPSVHGRTTSADGISTEMFALPGPNPFCFGVASRRWSAHDPAGRRDVAAEFLAPNSVGNALSRDTSAASGAPPPRVRRSSPGHRGYPNSRRSTCGSARLVLVGGRSAMGIGIKEPRKRYRFPRTHASPGHSPLFLDARPPTALPLQEICP